MQWNRSRRRRIQCRAGMVRPEMQLLQALVPPLVHGLPAGPRPLVLDHRFRGGHPHRPGHGLARGVPVVLRLVRVDCDGRSGGNSKQAPAAGRPGVIGAAQEKGEKDGPKMSGGNASGRASMAPQKQQAGRNGQGVPRFVEMAHASGPGIQREQQRAAAHSSTATIGLVIAADRFHGRSLTAASHGNGWD